MRYARLGDTGLIVSKLSLGTMTFGHVPSVPSIEVELRDSEITELDAMTQPQPLYPHWFN